MDISLKKHLRIHNWVIIALILVLPFFIVTNLNAATMSLTLTDDSWINKAVPDSNYGQNVGMYAHRWGPRRSLVKFNSKSLSDEVVDSAVLKLYAQNVNSEGTINIHMITSVWQEESVNWDNMPTFQASPIVSFEISASNIDSVIEIDITATVQQWVNGNAENYGLMMITSDNIAAKFYTKEFLSDPSRAATLIVNTTSIPEDQANVMDLSKLPYIIDQPGLYTLNRNWKLDVDNDDLFSFIQVKSDKVTIDLMGHELSMRGILPVYGINVSANGVMIQNGTIKVTHTISCDGSAILGVGNDVRVYSMIIAGRSECPTISGVQLSGVEHQIVRVSTIHELCDPMVEDCKIDRGGSIAVGDFSIVKDNHIFCDGEFCLEAGSNSVITNNAVSNKIRVVSDSLVVNNISGGVEETGAGNTVESNWNR